MGRFNHLYPTVPTFTDVEDEDVTDVEDNSDVEADQYDPAEHNVEDVLKHLSELDDDDERGRILDAERDGKARAGILGDN